MGNVYLINEGILKLTFVNKINHFNNHLVKAIKTSKGGVL
jgi:hypothetical protein